MKPLRLVALCLLIFLSSCHRKHRFSTQDFDSRALLPRLEFTLTDADTDKVVTAADFRGKAVLLYFGYTNCPNVCPITLYDLAHMIRGMGKSAQNLRILFVTVDPNRDTDEIMRQYTALFGTNVIGMRGTSAQLAAIAARYYAEYKVTPAGPGQDYTVEHTADVYAFGPGGQSQFIIGDLSMPNPDLKGVADDIRWLAMQ